VAIHQPRALAVSFAALEEARAPTLGDWVNLVNLATNQPTIDEQRFNDWLTSAAHVARYDNKLFDRVIELAQQRAAAAAMTEPAKSNVSPSPFAVDPSKSKGLSPPVAASPPAFPEPVTPRTSYQRATQTLLIWHAAKQIQTCVYEITNDLDPTRRPNPSAAEMERHLKRAEDVQAWAAALLSYIQATSVVVTPIMKK